MKEKMHEVYVISEEDLENLEHIFEQLKCWFLEVYSNRSVPINPSSESTDDIK